MVDAHLSRAMSPAARRDLDQVRNFMEHAKMRFEILSYGGFREIAVLSEDDVLMLAPGVTPLDLPGRLGARVRERLSRRELAIAPTALAVTGAMS
jgi:hypothetical protein